MKSEGSEPEGSQIEGKNILVTGANRGLGRALVTALLARGAGRIHATARRRELLQPLLVEGAGRVEALELDLTKPATLEAAAAAAADVDIVINNAGVLASYSALTDGLPGIRQDMETNFFGPLLLARAFAPALQRRPGGVLVNVLSVAALASMPALGGYSASKAAAHSLTQALRAELRARGIRVVAVFPGPVDTDMIRSFTLAKTPPDQVAQAIVDGLARGDEDIAPDPMSVEVFTRWRMDPKSIEQRFGTM